MNAYEIKIGLPSENLSPCKVIIHVLAHSVAQAADAGECWLADEGPVWFADSGRLSAEESAKEVKRCAIISVTLLCVIDRIAQ